MKHRHQDFGDVPLHRQDLHEDPLVQCQAWLQEAATAGERDPFAMTLATIAEDGSPSTRTVALKAIDDRGFIFTSAHDSPKVRELEADPRASIVLYWPATHSQVRAAGVVTRLHEDESAPLFRTRPRASQLALLAFPQSHPIPGRATLEHRYAALENEYRKVEVPLPGWGGFALAPSIVEFWRGHSSRLHDRFRCTRSPDGSWHLQRLAP